MKAPTIDLGKWGIKYVLQINFHPDTKDLVSIEVDFMNNGYDLMHMDNFRDKSIFENEYGNIKGSLII